MTWKANDPVAFDVYLADAVGPLTYANQALFLAAGFAFTWYQGATALATQPTYTITPKGVTGYHSIAFNLPAGVDEMLLTRPAGKFSDWDSCLLVVGTTDADGLYNLWLTSLGTPIASGATSQNFTLTDGDSFISQVQVPAALIAYWGFTDLSAAGWSVTGAVREVTDTTVNPPLAVLPAQIVDTTNRYVSFGWGAKFPTNMLLPSASILEGQKVYNYDVQLKIDQSFAITAAVAGASGTLTIAGDKRKYFSTNAGATFTVDSGPNAAGSPYTPTSVVYVGGNTVITVASLASATVAGNVVTTLTLTAITGQLTDRRQIDRT